MKKRSPITVAFLSSITIGIYMLFWLRDTRMELVAAGKKVLPVKVLLIPFVAIFVIILTQFFMKAAMNSTVTSSDSLSASNSISSLISSLLTVVVILVVFIIIPLTIYWYYHYCKAVESASNGQVSLAMSMVLLIVLGIFSLIFIWPGIMQNEYNKITSLTPDSFPPDRFSPMS